MIYRVADRSKLDKCLRIKRELAAANRRDPVDTGGDNRSSCFPINEDCWNTAKAGVYAYLTSLEICAKKYAVTEERLIRRIRVLTVTKNICMLH
jgi:hypothetical protein